MNAWSRIAVYSFVGLLLLSSAALALHPPVGSPAKGAGGSGGSGGGGCPDSNAIANFNTSSLVGASMMQNGSTWTYLFSSFQNLNSSGGIPGLIEFCVYTSPLPGSITAAAAGADGSAFGTIAKSSQGYFGFDRANGDPTNLPLNGTLDVEMGTATWTGSGPGTQTILLHINDPTECSALYGGGSTTCFVLPGTPPAPAPCNGEPVCKTVAIAEATSTSPLRVPRDTVLHLQYTYTISDAATNSFNMEFLAAAPGGHTTGVKDSFTCEQAVDPNGTPSAYGYYHNYSGTGLDLRLSQSSDPTCPRPLFVLASHTGAVVLHPGQSIVFTLDITTTPHGFTGTGVYCINAGVAVVWYQSNDGLYHYYHSPMVDVTVS